MPNKSCEICGGCCFRAWAEDKYRSYKLEDFKKTISLIKDSTPVIEKPIFIKDGLRRRAELKFSYIKKKLQLGFNEKEKHNLVDIINCPMLDEELNILLPHLRSFIEEFCKINITVRNKKKVEIKNILSGAIKLLHADNGIDILLEIEEEPSLEHRILVAEFVNEMPKICRISWKIKNNKPETIVEKYVPEIYISDCAIELPQDVFLQASKEAENQMINKVMEYISNTTGKIADLFCGLGTFTYPLAKIKENEITSIDSSELSLNGLQKALNRNQLHNVKVISKNLFKYPLDSTELKNIRALVIDPPRAGAHEQCREIAQLPPEDRPEKVVFISCNPKTFVYDAELLIKAGYNFEKVTLIDQFVYSKHQELIALFTSKVNNKGE